MSRPWMRFPWISCTTDAGGLSPKTPGFAETWSAQGSPVKRAVKERGRWQSLPAAEPQRGREERPLASALTGQGLGSPCYSLPLPGSKPSRMLLNHSFHQSGPHHTRFIISELSYLPVQLMRVCFIRSCSFSSGARLPPAGMCLFSPSSGKAPASGASARLRAPDATNPTPAPRGCSNLGPAVETPSSGEPKLCVRPELQPLAASGTCLHPLLQAASLTPAGGGYTGLGANKPRLVFAGQEEL